MLALALFAGLPIVAGPFSGKAECAVPGDPAAKFTYAVEVRDSVATVTITPARGSSVPASAMTANDSYISVTQGPPDAAGKRNPSALFFNPGTFATSDGKLSFTASGLIQSGKLDSFDFELRDPKGDIKAVCTTVRSPDAGESSKQ